MNNGDLADIEYITIATTGNYTTFGDRTVAASNPSNGAPSDATRGVWGGGTVSSVVTNVMDYITINTTGNATDFGDLSVSRSILAGASNGHGGL